MSSPKQDPRLRLYIALDGDGRPKAGSAIWRRRGIRVPQEGYWADITDCAWTCCSTTSTSTSTSTTSSTTTTTTTT